MTINIADNSPRVSYTVAQGATQTSFTVSFEFFDNADLNVYVDGTLKTITTHYTVSGGDGSTGTVTMTVVGATGGSTVVITRDIALERTTDFPASGAFNIITLNTELDRLIAIAADLDDRAGRALQLTDFDSAVSLVLPAVDTRKGKTLAFNASTGAVEAGPSISDTQAVSAASADIATLADIEDGTDATNAIQTVAGIASNVSTVAGVSANVTTVAGVSSNVTTVAGGISNVNTVASNISSVNSVATNITSVVAVANDLAEAVSEVETVANDLNEAVSEIDTVAANIANVNAVGGISGNVTTVAGISANVTTVAGISSNVSTVAGISSNVTTVAGISSAVSTVAADGTDIGTVAGISSNVTTVAGISSNVTTVAGISANVTTVATNNANVTTVASNITGVNSFAERYRVGSSDPSSSLDEGDLAYNTTSNALKYYNGSSWQSISPGISNVVEDTTPQLGGNLDVNSNNITSSANLTIDVGGDIILDAAGEEVIFKDGSANIGHVSLDSDNLTIKSLVQDKDIIFQGDDGGSGITALTIDMSEAGKATFNNDVVATRFVDSGSASYYLDPFGTSVLAYSYLQQTFALNSALTGTTPTCTASTHSSFSLTTSGNTTFTFSVGAIGTGYLIGFVLKLTSGGSHTITWPNTVDWAGGSAPDAPASGETDILVFTSIDAGTNWYGVRVIDAAA